MFGKETFKYEKETAPLLKFHSFSQVVLRDCFSGAVARAATALERYGIYIFGDKHLGVCVCVGKQHVLCSGYLLLNGRDLFPRKRATCRASVGAKRERRDATEERENT